MRRLLAARRQTDGFTLIELLIAVGILFFLIAAIGTAMIVAFRGISGRSQTVTDTSGAQLLTSYLVTDAQSADHVNPNTLAAGNADKFTCDAAGLLELRWTDANGTSGTTDVVYKIESTSTTDYRLTRYVYTADVAAKSCGAGPTDQTVMVPNVSNVAADTKAVCDTASCTDASDTVGLHVTAFSAEPKSNQYSAYTFDVSGARRVSCRPTVTC